MLHTLLGNEDVGLVDQESVNKALLELGSVATAVANLENSTLLGTLYCHSHGPLL